MIKPTSLSWSPFVASWDIAIIIPEITAWLRKCKWGKFIVFELKCYLIKANWVIECKLKTATKIITNQVSEQRDHKCTDNIHFNELMMTEWNFVCSLEQESPQVHCACMLSIQSCWYEYVLHACLAYSCTAKWLAKFPLIRYHINFRNYSIGVGWNWLPSIFPSSFLVYISMVWCNL